jgi:hypothetical protein
MYANFRKLPLNGIYLSASQIGRGSNHLGRAPSERIRTASEIPIEVDLTDEDAVPAYMKISEKVLHLRRLGMPYISIAGHLGVNLWMAKKAARWGNIRKA